jgi:adenylate kinase
MSEKKIIIITGVPGVGKSTLAKMISERIKSNNISVSDLAKREGLILNRDTDRATDVVDLPRLRKKISEIIEITENSIIIEGHYAYDLVSQDLVSIVIVLRRAPWKLKEELIKRGYPRNKIQENVEAELLDVVLVEAIEALGPNLVCEIDTTNKTPLESSEEIMGIIKGTSLCDQQLVDWLGHPEAKQLFEEK